MLNLDNIIILWRSSHTAKLLYDLHLVQPSIC